MPLMVNSDRPISDVASPDAEVTPDDDRGTVTGDEPSAKGAMKSQYVSYSANFEDVILHRIFAKRPPGFYVDVGAAHPTFENDTKMLYDLGWHGINIEPNPAFFEVLAAERPRDRNYCAALSDRVGTVTYYDVVGTGLSTCDRKLAERAREEDHEIVERRIAATTLAAILDEVKPASIELLKIDVEGFEEQVLAGNDWTKYRPSVILVEATYPESAKRRPTAIRADLEKRNYRWRYFDGLNDFYVSNDFEVSETAFDRPPNVFDGFTLLSVVKFNSAVEYAHSLKAEVKRTQERASFLDSKCNELGRQKADLLAALRERERLVGPAVRHAGRGLAEQGLGVAAAFDEDGQLPGDLKTEDSTKQPPTATDVPTLTSDESIDTSDSVLRIAVENLQEQNAKLRNELQDEKFERLNLAKAVRSMRQEMVQFSREEEASLRSAEELAHVQALLLQSQATQASLKEQLSAAQAAQTPLEERLSAAQAAQASSEKQLSAARAAQAPLEERLSAAQAAKASLEEQLSAAQAAQTSSKEQLAAAQAAQASLEQQLAAVHLAHNVVRPSRFRAIRAPIRAAVHFVKSILP